MYSHSNKGMRNNLFILVVPLFTVQAKKYILKHVHNNIVLVPQIKLINWEGESVASLINASFLKKTCLDEDAANLVEYVDIRYTVQLYPLQ